MASERKASTRPPGIPDVTSSGGQKRNDPSPLRSRCYYDSLSDAARRTNESYTDVPSQDMADIGNPTEKDESSTVLVPPRRRVGHSGTFGLGRLYGPRVTDLQIAEEEGKEERETIPEPLRRFSIQGKILSGENTTQ